MMNTLKLTALAFAFLVGLSGFSQDQRIGQEHQTLFGNKKGFGGFIGFSSKTSEINGEMAYFLGGEANFVFGHSVNIGFAGYGMVSNVFSNETDDLGDPYYLQMGYGGLNIEPVIGSYNLIHVTLPVLLGAGGIAETHRPYFDGQVGNGLTTEFDQRLHRSDLFLVAEPGVNLELNLFKIVRVAGGVSYRFVSDAQIPGIDRSDIQGLTGNLSLRIGWF